MAKIFFRRSPSKGNDGKADAALTAQTDKNEASAFKRKYFLKKFTLFLKRVLTYENNRVIILM
jgi:hypothetical protein